MGDIVGRLDGGGDAPTVGDCVILTTEGTALGVVVACRILGESVGKFEG